MQGRIHARYPVFISLIGLVLTSCLPMPENISWSPDGQYLAFVGQNDNELWLWDARTRQAKRILSDEVVACRYFPSGDYILVGLESDKSDMLNVAKLNIQSGDKENLISDVFMYDYDTSSDGKYLYYVKENENQERYELREMDLENPSADKCLMSFQSEIHMPRVNESRTQILLFTDETELLAFDQVNGATRVLVANRPEDDSSGRTWLEGSEITLKNERTGVTHRFVVKESDDEIWCPTWIDDDRFIYILCNDDENEEIGTLFVRSFSGGTTKRLCNNVHSWVQPSLSPDRTSIAFTIADATKEIMQAALVDVESGEVKILTDEPLNASLPVFSPTGDRVAYLCPYPGVEAATVRILDLTTGQKTVVWRDEEERLFAAAESLMQSAEYSHAVAMHRDLLARYPQTRFHDHSWYYIMLLYLQPPLTDLDAAFTALKMVEDQHLRTQARPRIWREEDQIAEDPPEDWIHTYGTQASRERFEFNTDLTRDLVGLSARWSPERLYLKIDYNSPRDLSGLTFQDTLLLFDYDSPDSGFRRLSPSTEWDRGAERQVLIHHWYEQSENSQYDVEILDEKGEVISRFCASGFASPSYPHFDLLDVIQKDSNSIVISLSRKMLDLTGKKRAHLQICTFKGGIEMYEKKERPREASIDGRLVCDVADTFGPENTAKRLKADSEKRKPPIIRGCLPCLEPEGE